MNDFECFLIGTYVIQSKNSADLLPPFVVTARQSISLKSLLDSRCDFIDVVRLKFESESVVGFGRGIATMENAVKLVSSDIVRNVHILDDLYYFVGPRD